MIVCQQLGCSESAMGSDSISNASKDLGKKRRTNRLAKLKQSKLDVRREQWLSQVKIEACKEDSYGWGKSPSSSLQIADEGKRSKTNINLMSREVDIKGSSVHESDVVSLMNCPNTSSLGRHDDSMKEVSGSCCSSASSRCCTRSVSEADEDDVCLYDWEAIADALTADKIQSLEPPAGLKTNIIFDECELTKKNSGVDMLKTESKVMVPRTHSNCRAWCPDDAFRPQGLPNLSKQCILTMNSERLCGLATTGWGWQNILSQSSCPICCEDFDVTDSYFLPCSCGFRLCLFCHKRILETDDQCPGCRKQYGHIIRM